MPYKGKILTRTPPPSHPSTYFNIRISNDFNLKTVLFVLLSFRDNIMLYIIKISLMYDCFDGQNKLLRRYSIILASRSNVFVPCTCPHKGTSSRAYCLTFPTLPMIIFHFRLIDNKLYKPNTR